MGNAAVIPERTTDPALALELMEMDGAAILEVGAGPLDASSAERALRAVLGDRLRAYRRPVNIGANPVSGQPSFFDPAARKVNADRTVRGTPHVDGYMVYGELYPDAVFLLCERQADQGGESFMIDGLRLAMTLAGDPAERELVRFLFQTPIEQSTPAGVRVVAPVVSRTAGGRLAIRYHEHQRLAEDRPARPGHDALLRRWHEVVAAAVTSAPRFRLKPGDFMCMDNFRAIHGREAYAGGDRLLHRIWSWTDRGFGVPSAANGHQHRTADLVTVT